jgi:hypothetical protein
MDIKLPNGKQPPKTIDPRITVLYSLPKAGKTVISANLPNSLLLDLERGSDFVNAARLTVIGLKPDPYGPKETEEQTKARFEKQEYYLSEVISTLRKGHNYKYIILDTATVFADWCEYEATLMYMQSSAGKNWNRWSIEDQQLNSLNVAGTIKPKAKWEAVTTMGQGFGYRWLTAAYEKWMDYIKEVSPRLIINGHVKLKTIVNKVGKEVEAKDLDLTGKLKVLTTAVYADAIGYFFREEEKGYISFIPSDEVIGGNRATHLEGEVILVSEKLADKTVKTYWHNIFKELAVE